MHKRLFYQVMFCIVLSTVSTMFQVKPNILVCFLALYCKLFASLDTKSICNDVNANMVQMFGLGLFALTYGVVSAHFPLLSCQTAEQAFRHILNIVDYSKYVMKPLLGEKYVHSGVSDIALTQAVTQQMRRK